MSAAARSEPDLPTPVEMLESVLLLISDAVVAAPILPGFTLCVAGVSVMAFAVLIPLAAAAALVTLVGAVLAIPVLIVRSFLRIRVRRAAPAPKSASVLAADV